MSISAISRKKWNEFSADEKDRIVRMAWEDRTAFESIEEQFGLTPNETIKFMRTQLDTKSYRRWRERAGNKGHLKNEALRPFVEGRFKCSRQRIDGSTKGWK